MNHKKQQNTYREISFGHSPWLSNDYLGFSRHPDLLSCLKSAELGSVGSTGSRLLSGHQGFFDEVECEIAEFFGAESALVFSCGYLANFGVLRSLHRLGLPILSDEWNHASLIDGLSGYSQKKIYKHKNIPEPSESSLIVTESHYSMSGTCVLPPSRVEINDSSFYYVDEAHAAGVYEGGKGIWSQYRGECARLVTFGKALGGMGAALLGPKWFKEYLVNECRSFIYTTAPSPVIWWLMRKSIRLLQKEKWRIERLHDLSIGLRKKLIDVLSVDCFITLPDSEEEWSSPIFLIKAGSIDKAMLLSEFLSKSGISVKPIRPPTLPEENSGVRLVMNVERTKEEISHLLHSLKEFTKCYQ